MLQRRLEKAEEQLSAKAAAKEALVKSVSSQKNVYNYIYYNYYCQCGKQCMTN